MDFLNPLERVLSELDHVRLSALLRRHPFTTSGPLEQLLEGASTLLPQEVPADIVTMHSRVRVVDMATGERSEVTLSYPQEADATCGRVSVLSPVGAALLGRRAGDRADWPAPDGRPHAVRIEEVVYQPEAAGDYTA